MARSSECTEQYAQKVFDRDPHCQRRLLTTVSAAEQETKKDFLRLLQLRVFGFRFFQDWDVGFGVIPERENIPVGGLCFWCVAL